MNYEEQQEKTTPKQMIMQRQILMGVVHIMLCIIENTITSVVAQVMGEIM